MRSIWEEQSFYANRYYIVIGSGFMGLWTALLLKNKYPERNVLVIERGKIPWGASTRNAGFICFGSFTELLEDAEMYGIDEMLEVTAKRYEGIQKIKLFAKEYDCNLEISGGYELIDSDPFFVNSNDINDKMEWMNQILKAELGIESFANASHKINELGFKGFNYLIHNPHEGVVHPGKLVQALIRACNSKGVNFLFNTEVKKIFEEDSSVSVSIDEGISIKGEKLFICTNAFSQSLLPGIPLQPARGQVLYAKPAKPVAFKGSFHSNRGYYYFRDFDGGIILGGGRHLAKEEEATTEFELTPLIQNALEEFLAKLLPGQKPVILQRWSGIMAMGDSKKPIVKQISNRIFASVKLSGVGVAIAPVLAQELIEKENPRK